MLDETCNVEVTWNMSFWWVGRVLILSMSPYVAILGQGMVTPPKFVLPSLLNPTQIGEWILLVGYPHPTMQVITREIWLLDTQRNIG